MTNYKVGDRVRFIEKCSHVAGEGDVLTIRIIDKGTNTNYFYFKSETEAIASYCWSPDTHFVLADPPQKTFETLQPGDVLVGYRDGESTVIDVLPHSFLVSFPDEPDNATTWYTPAQAQTRGFRIKNAAPLKLTRQQIAEKFGVDEVEIEG